MSVSLETVEPVRQPQGADGFLRLRQIFTAALKETFPNGWYGYKIDLHKPITQGQSINMDQLFNGLPEAFTFNVSTPFDKPLLERASVQDEVDAVLAAGQVKEAILNHVKSLVEDFSRPSNFRIKNLLPQLLLLSSLGFDRDWVKAFLAELMAFYRWEEEGGVCCVTFYEKLSHPASGSLMLLGEITLHRRDGDSLRWAVRLESDGKSISEAGRTEGVPWVLPNFHKGTDALECFADQLMDLAGLPLT